MESSEPHKQQLPKNCHIVLQLVRYICAKLIKAEKKISQTHCCFFSLMSQDLNSSGYIYPTLWLFIYSFWVCVSHELMNRAVFVIDNFRVPCFLLVLSFSSEWISFYHWYNKTSCLKTSHSALRCYVTDISFYSVHQTMNREYIFHWLV